MRAHAQITIPRNMSDHDLVAYAVEYERAGDTYSLDRAAALGEDR